MSYYTPDLPARRTTYRGVQMRSVLEASYAGYLDRRGWSWKYEPVAFASPCGRWTPDFKIRYPGRLVYVDVKPYDYLRLASPDDIGSLLARMEGALLTEPECRVAIDGWDYEAAVCPVFTVWRDGRHSWEFEGDVTGLGYEQTSLPPGLTEGEWILPPGLTEGEGDEDAMVSS